MGEPSHERLLERLRPRALARLLKVRASIDPAYARIPDHQAERQFDRVLGKMAAFLGEGDLEPYRRFADRWAAMRAGQGFSREGLIHSAVAIGDVLVRTAREELGQTPECESLVRAVTHMTYLAARMLVDNLAADVERAEKRLREVRAHG